MLKNIGVVMRLVVAIVCMLSTAVAVAASEVKMDKDVVIASRGTAKVTFGDVDAYVELRVPEADRAGFMDSPKRIENLLQGLLLQQQLAYAAPDPKPDVRSEKDGFKRLDLQQKLSQQTLEKYKKSIVVPDLVPLARESYAVHKSEYKEPGEVDVQQVLITTDKRSDEDAKKLASDIETQAKAAPDSFGDLVKKYSDESDKDKNQGMIVGAANEKYAHQLEEPVTALKHDGEISPVVKTSYGYHVLKLVKRLPDRQLSFDEVRESLLTKMTLTYSDQKMREFIGSFENMPLEADPDRVGSLRDRYVPAAAVGAESKPVAAPKTSK